MTNHTPTPWKFSPWHIEEGPSAVRAPEGWLICETSSDANAEFIVRAVNEYDSLKRDAERYRWLRERDLETIDNGGVFAGITPENMILNLEDLDRHIDQAMST